MFAATTSAGFASDPFRFASDSSRLSQNVTEPGIQNLRQMIRSGLLSALEVRRGESVVDFPDSGQGELAIYSFDVVLADFDALHDAGPPELADQLFRMCRFGGRIGLAWPTPGSFLARIQQTVNSYLSPSSVARYAGFEGTRENLDELFGARAKALGAADRAVTFDYSSAEYWLASWLSSYRPLKCAFRLVDPDWRDQLCEELIGLARSFAVPVKDMLRIRCDYLECLVHKGRRQ